MLSNAVIHHLAPITPTDPTMAGGGFVNFEGASVSGTITGITAHTWIDDASGLYHTTADLNAEWTGYYQQLIEGHGSSLTPEQHAEAQAQAVFLNTGLGKLPMPQQTVIRQDVQREMDAIAAAEHISALQNGTNPNAPFTELSYFQLTQTLQANPQLEELAVQGHGLNAPPLPRYSGYTNDAQHNTDNTTKYIGPGSNHNQKAVADFMDDAIMSHALFPVVMHQGHFIQLNQDGDHESTLPAQVNDINIVWYGKVLTAKDFKS